MFPLRELKKFFSNRSLIPNIHRQTRLEGVDLVPMVAKDQTIDDGETAIMLMNYEGTFRPIIGN